MQSQLTLDLFVQLDPFAQWHEKREILDAQHAAKRLELNNAHIALQEKTAPGVWAKTWSIHYHEYHDALDRLADEMLPAYRALDQEYPRPSA